MLPARAKAELEWRRQTGGPGQEDVCVQKRRALQMLKNVGAAFQLLHSHRKTAVLKDGGARPVSFLL